MLKRATVFSMAAAMFGAAPAVLAHTGIKDQATEAKSLYTAATITHGCGVTHGGDTIPVIAQSMVFPNRSDAQAFRINSDGTEVPINPANYIDLGPAGRAALPIVIAPSGVQDHNVFANEVVKYDPNKNKRGFAFTNGSLQTDLTGVIPFRLSGIKFKTTSCAKSLQLRIAIANWCKTTQDTNDDFRADIWIGHMTTMFNDWGVMPYPDNPVGQGVFWPTLTVNRDLATNPLPASCDSGFDIALQPSDKDIDTNLPIQGYWPKP